MTPRHQPISSATKEWIDRLLLEKISLAGIVRATGVSERWLQYYVNKKLGAVKREVEVKSKKKEKLTIQCDEMWSFVSNKDNKQWIWLAIDASTKEIVGVYIGKRDQASAQGLWDYLPPVYRQCAVSYTDFWSA
jgi:insertion element IS1 protein InsB